MDKQIYYDFDGDKSKFIIDNDKAFFPYPCNDTVICSPVTVQLKKGNYKFELWGGQGGNGRFLNLHTINEESGGRAAYVSGDLLLLQTSLFYLYIGGKGQDQESMDSGVVSEGGYNGGGKGGIDLREEGQNSSPESAAGGGGATDIRLIKDNTNKALMSRIIVAAGGGGAESNNRSIEQRGGYGGILEGKSNHKYNNGGTQTTGNFGFGGEGYSFSYNLGGSIGGSGSGYFGGYIINTTGFENMALEYGGAGGSSFVSGCDGCNAVEYNENDEIINSNQQNHYSGFVFKNIIMKSGDEYMNKPNNDSTEKGHEGSGAVLITYLGPLNKQTCSCLMNNIINYIRLLIIILL